MYIVDPSVSHGEEVPNVLQCEEYISCTQCHSKVMEVDGIYGECKDVVTEVVRHNGIWREDPLIPLHFSNCLGTF